jgi:PAS domain S-box-containing protein
MKDISSKHEAKKIVTIFIVEDEYILAINLQEILETLGYTVVGIATCAEEAIEKAIELRPNLVLMDIRLPGEMDGIQAAEEIWNRVQIPVIYITGYSDSSTVERAALTFPFGYIVKPLKEHELHIAIETALHRYEREQFLNTVLQGIADGVVVVNPKLSINYLNPTAEKLTGWRLNEAKEQTVTQVIQLIDEQTQLPVVNPLITALEQQTTVYLANNTSLICRDRTIIPVADSATPLKDNNGMIIGAVMVFWDDTRRRLIEERNLAAERARQLEIQLAELERLNQLKEDFLATTSHEMRTPLANIKMAIVMIEIFLKEQGILSSDDNTTSVSLTRYLKILREQCEQEISLVEDLLSMRRIDADSYLLEFTSIELQNWLPHIIEGFEERIQAQQQLLQLTISPNLPPLTSDLSSLTRIISELLNNACKYTPPTEQIIVTAQIISLMQNQVNKDTPSDKSYLPIPFFEIRISNSGVEISPREQSRIFEPFYRIHRGDRWQQGGSGLGLTLVKKLVEYLQGNIAVTSAQGWTTFIIQLPVVPN